MESPSRAPVYAVAALFVLCVATTSARADSRFEEVGVGLAFALPLPGVSLFGRLDDRWSGSVTATAGVDLRLNYTRESSRGGYWIVGAGYFPDGFGVVRGGYGRARQRGRWRWHLEATLNLPIVNRQDDSYAALGTGVAAAYTLLIPIGFGVHYTFGAR